jgi:hypothetical protein
MKIYLYTRIICRLRVLENRILKRIFGPKRDENGEWRRLHNGELHSLYRSPSIVSVIKCRRLKWAGHIAIKEEVRSAFKILTSTPAGKRSLRRSRCGWDDNIRMDIKGICIRRRNWSIRLRFESACECGIETLASVSHGVLCIYIDPRHFHKL